MPSEYDEFNERPDPMAESVVVVIPDELWALCDPTDGTLSTDSNDAPFVFLSEVDAAECAAVSGPHTLEKPFRLDEHYREQGRAEAKDRIATLEGLLRESFPLLGFALDIPGKDKQAMDLIDRIKAALRGEGK